MKKFLLVLSVAVLAPTLAVAQGVAADRLHCGADQMQVCTTPDADGNGFKVLVDSRARARTDCDVSQPRGVDLRCVAESDVRAAEQAACEALDGEWRWSRRHERCYQHTEPREERGQSDDGGTSTFGAGVAVAVPRCTETDRARLTAELDRIWEARTVVEDFGPLQDRAVEVYSILVECDDGSPESRHLIDLAANMATAFEEADPTFPDYTDEFQSIRDQIAALEDRPVVVEVQPAQNWCTDTHAGRWWCIAFPAILGTAAIVVGGVCGAGLCEEEPGLPDHMFYGDQ